jgi:hypothetical protein
VWAPNGRLGGGSSASATTYFFLVRNSSETHARCIIYLIIFNRVDTVLVSHNHVGGSMTARALHRISNLFRPFTETRTKHQQTPSIETTELHNLASRSRNDGSSYASIPAKDVNLQQARLNRAGRPASIKGYKQRLSGWRFGVLHFSIWAVIVFTVNLIITVWGSVTHREDEGLLKEGDCGRIKNINSGLHILINILSTILLSGSNYCMQCLSAPTRKEVDRAHASRRWLDIGIPSFRNLRHITRWRLALWLLLGISSLPLHLL